ncbi:MAG TPA: hypothetical protein VF746_26335 [Longimicrobium sp.]|jgi:hypothetical protein
MYFGLAFYQAHDIREAPEHVVAALESLIGRFVPQEVRFQGMFTGTDKFSRLTKPSVKAIRQLEVDLRGGVYSDLLAFVGLRSATVATLGIGVPRTDGETVNVEYVASCEETGDDSPDVRLGFALRDIFEPRYGISLWGASHNDVSSELSGVPIAPWDQPLPEEEVNRLSKIQRLQKLFGTYARGDGWGTFLGPHLVKEMGGLAQMQQDAPVSCVDPLPGGGAYLQLSPRPLLVRTEGYRQAVKRLGIYLRPVLPQELRG